MKKVEDTTADYILQGQAAMSGGLNDKRRYYYNAKLVGLLETYHIICVSIDVIFEENMDNMFGNLDFSEIGDKQ